MAQLDARPTGDQEVAGSIPPGRLHSFAEIDHEIRMFYDHFFPSADLRRAVVSFWRTNVHNTRQPFRGLCLPSKRVVRYSDHARHDRNRLTGRQTSAQIYIYSWILYIFLGKCLYISCKSSA